MKPGVLLDTGPVVAVLSESDAHHAVCVAALKNLPARMLTCWPVITEAAWLLRSRPAAIQALLRLVREGVYVPAEPQASDAAAIAMIMHRYRSAGAQLADACLVHLADCERIDTVFTLDRRHFSVYRTRAGRPLRIVPDLETTAADP